MDLEMGRFRKLSWPIYRYSQNLPTCGMRKRVKNVRIGANRTRTKHI
jgi:hypothetical protein